MIVASSSVELGSDEHTFVIRGEAGTVVGSPWDGSTLVTIPTDVDQVGDVWVNTGDQWGPFSVTTQVHDTPPPDDPSWEDVVEITLTCTSGLLVAELVNHEPSTSLTTDPGSYRIRVCARGRVDPELDDDYDDQDEPGAESTEPVEHYLVQAWPALPTDPTAPVIVRDTSSWAAAQLAGPRTYPEVEGTKVGLAAAARIGHDADGGPGARHLSGTVSAITLEGVVPGTRRKVSKYLKYGPTLSRHVPTWSFMAGPGWDQLGAANYCAAGGGHPDQLTGANGVIRVVRVADDSPRSWVSQWAWMVPGPGPNGRWIANLVPLLVEDTTVTATFTQTKDEQGQPWTTVQVQHDLIPVEWVDDLTSWWTYQLAMMTSLAATT
ncbi:hypothetical protein [Nocardioides caricicola]|uniref:Uncharacterized protein n=1 Tax=Nocardioides caricicola TaxID=634770 RepID=A0ABW0N2X5_9ACTN